MASHNRVKVAILGASGYSGIEAVRMLAFHPFVELSVLTSEHYAGREVAEVYRHLAGLDLPAFEELRPDLIKGRAEVVISCLPERVGAPLIAELIAHGIKVIDFSADFRLKDPAAYRTTYGAEHPAPALLKQAVYGLTEFHRREIREARMIANPGCYPTGTLLGMLPLISRDLVDPSFHNHRRQVGHHRRAPQAQIEQLFAEVNENFRAYKVGNHRHAPEMEQEIGGALGREVAMMFVPHLLPVNARHSEFDLHAPARAAPPRKTSAPRSKRATPSRASSGCSSRANCPSSRTCAPPISAKSPSCSIAARRRCACSPRSTIWAKAPPARRCRIST